MGHMCPTGANVCALEVGPMFFIGETCYMGETVYGHLGIMGLYEIAGRFVDTDGMFLQYQRHVCVL